MNLEISKLNEKIQGLEKRIDILEKEVEIKGYRIYYEQEQRERDFWKIQTMRYEGVPHGSIQAIVMDNKFSVPLTSSKVVVELPIKCEKKWKSDGDKIDCSICKFYDYSGKRLEEAGKNSIKTNEKIAELEVELGKLKKSN